jgi:hypothetical protein
MGIEIDPETVPQVDDGAVRWKSKFQGQPDQVDLAKQTESLCIGLLLSEKHRGREGRKVKNKSWYSSATKEDVRIVVVRSLYTTW